MKKWPDNMFKDLFQSGNSSEGMRWLIEEGVECKVELIKMKERRGAGEIRMGSSKDQECANRSG